MVDRGLVGLYAAFCMHPELRPTIETSLAVFAKLALVAAATTGLDDAGDAALDAATLLAAGDPGPAADLAVKIADDARVEGDTRQVLARWVWTLLSDVAAAYTKLH